MRNDANKCENRKTCEREELLSPVDGTAPLGKEERGGEKEKKLPDER